ncbi:MAG: phosphopantetheine adenylyltransferase [Nitrososphaerales archaeon]
MPEIFKYHSIAVGGTFDHIHRGHRKLLERAFGTGKSVVIGLMSDAFVASSGKKIQHDYDFRKEELARFLEKAYPNRKYTITKLEARFGPSIFTKDIDAIVVSTETMPTVESANKRRRESGLAEMQVEVVPMIMADDNDRISSTRVRAGEIDPEGHLKK